jgi:archaetidylinositol phosphate synthase
MSHHTWMHAIVRPVTSALRSTPVSPNHLTGLRLATGIASCLLLSTGDPGWMDVGGGVFLLSFLLDRADGELARQTGKCSPWGHRFDLVADYASNILIFVGLGVGLRHAGIGVSAILLGFIAGGAIAGIFGLVSRIERTDGVAAASFPTAAGFDPDDAMLVVPVAVWSDAEALLLIAAAIGAPAFLTWTCWRFRKHVAYSRLPSR